MRRFVSQSSFQDSRSLPFGQCPGFQIPTPFAAQSGPQHTPYLAQQEHGNQSRKQALSAIPQRLEVAAQVPEDHMNGAETGATDMPGLCSTNATRPLESQNPHGPDVEFLSSLDIPTFTTPPPGDQQMGCAGVPQNVPELQLPDSLRIDDMLPESAPISSTSNIEPRAVSSDDLFGDLNSGSIDDFAVDDDASDFGLPPVMSSDTSSSPSRNGVGSSDAGPELQPEILTPGTPAAQATPFLIEEKGTAEGVETSEAQESNSTKDLFVAAMEAAFEEEDHAGDAAADAANDVADVQTDDAWEDDNTRSLFMDE